MDFKEMLRKISFPLKTKENEREQLKEEELYIEDVQMLVRIKIIIKNFFIYIYNSIVIKITTFYQ